MSPMELPSILAYFENVRQHDKHHTEEGYSALPLFVKKSTIIIDEYNSSTKLGA
jgi:hypothetical protein